MTLTTNTANTDRVSGDWRPDRRQLKLVVGIVATLIATVLGIYWGLQVKTLSGWEYQTEFSDLEGVSGLAKQGDLLYATQELFENEGRLISISPNGKRELIVGSLQKPDGLVISLGNLIFTQETIRIPVFEVINGLPSPLFFATRAEGIASTLNGDLYVIEDRPAGELLKYSRHSGLLEVLISDLVEAEGVCVMENGDIYYTEKREGVVYRLDDEGASPFLTDLKKPGYLYCDEIREGIWITEDRQNFGRLLFSDSMAEMTVIASGLKSPQSIVMDGEGSLLLAEQGRGRILRMSQTLQDHFLVLAAGSD